MPRPGRWDVVALGAAVVGAGLRVRQLAVDRSLWVDEALLADNILERGYRDLLQPLSGQQGAPVGFLWAAKTVTALVGVDERWMRAPSLVAGIGLLPLVWLLARRLASPRTAALATALVAVAPGLVRYSAELKQYASDAAIAVALALLAERVLRKRRATDLAVLAAVGAVAAWFSHPAVLVLAGIGLLLSVEAVRRRDVTAIVQLVPVGVLWLGSLAVLWWVSLRDLTSNEFLTGYWQAGFPDRLGPAAVGWAWSSTVDLLDGLGGFAAPAVAAAAAVLGCCALAAGRGLRPLSLLLVAFPALLAAAALEQYPYRGRLALFVLPVLLVAIAAVAEVPWPRLKAPAVLAVVLLGVGPAVRSAREAIDPTPYPESRPVLEALAERWSAGEAILVHGLAGAPFAVYGDDLGLEVTGRTSWADRCPAPAGPLAGGGQVWVVFAYTHSAAPPDEASILRSHLDALGRRIDLIEAYDAFVGRWDLGAPPTEPDGAQVTPATRCLEVSRPGR